MSQLAAIVLGMCEDRIELFFADIVSYLMFPA